MNATHNSRALGHRGSIHVLVWSCLLLSFGAFFSCGEDGGTEVATPATLRVFVTRDGTATTAKLSVRSYSTDFGASTTFDVPGSVTLPVPVGKLRASILLGEERYDSNTFGIAPQGQSAEGFFITADDEPLDIFVEFGTASVDVSVPDTLLLENPITVRLDQRNSNYRHTAHRTSTDRTIHFELPDIVEGQWRFSGLTASHFSGGGRCGQDTVSIQFTGTPALEITETRTLRGRLILPWRIDNLDEVTFVTSRDLVTYPLTWEGLSASFEGEVNCIQSYDLWFPHPDSAGARVIDVFLNFDDPQSLNLQWQFAGLEVSIETDDDVHPYQTGSDSPFRTNTCTRTGSGTVKLLIYAERNVTLFYEPSEPGAMPPEQEWIDPASERPWFATRTGETRQISWNIQPGGTVTGVFSTPFTDQDVIGLTSRFSQSDWPVEIEADGRTFALHQLPPGDTELYRVKKFNNNAWWYPGSYNWQDRKTFVVRPGETVSGINF